MTRYQQMEFDWQSASFFAPSARVPEPELAQLVLPPAVVDLLHESEVDVAVFAPG